MTTTANAAREILSGIYAGLAGRTPSAGLEARIRFLERQVREDRGPRCYCRAHEHGGDCMCNEE